MSGQWSLSCVLCTLSLSTDHVAAQRSAGDAFNVGAARLPGTVPVKKQIRLAAKEQSVSNMAREGSPLNSKRWVRRVHTGSDF